ncbi:hypothetical protein scyTo_0025712, partial [Scyliorhinus torazame]|nr:hypothetical protein [Scyliorhinus torazame]
MLRNVPVNLQFNKNDYMLCHVTEEVRAAVESRLKESAEYQRQLEKRILEAENEKQALTDEKRKTIENLEQQ